MISRLFSRCLGRREGEDDRDRLIADGEAANAAAINGDPASSDASSSTTCCNSNKFWIRSEFAYGFTKALVGSTYGLAALITELANMKSDYASADVSNTALGISAPFAVLFATGEAACHYAESMNISSNADNTGANQDANANDDRAPNERPSLRAWQHVLIISHYLSDVTADAGNFLAIADMLGASDALAEATGTKEYQSYMRLGMYGGLCVYSMWGNVQEARNARDSFREMNDQAARANRSAV